jgi:hypothetical protein
MTLVRGMTQGALVVVSTAWAACLVILGLWLALDGPPANFPIPRPVCLSIGVSAASGGLLIFMALVADRLVPSLRRRQTMWGLEMAMFALFLSSFLLSFVLV